MADLKITQLPSASLVTGSDVLPVVRAGVTDQITVNNFGQSVLNIGLPLTASYIDFNTGSAVPAWQSGRVYWDNTDGCLAVYNAEADVTLQVGQENWTRVWNGTGVTITNGSPVRITGTHGDVPQVVLAQSVAVSGSANLVNQILGVATHDIENNTYGYITTQGLVRGLNTNAYNDGDTLYVSQTAGQYVTTQPPAPYEIIPVGQVVKASPGASGIIYVAVQQPIDFSDLSSVRRTGVDYTVGDIWSYQPSSSFNIWVHGKQLTGSYGVTGSWNVTGSINVNSITGSFTGSLNGAIIDNTAWTSYTPTWTAQVSDPTLGNGTITGAYKVIGKTCFVRIKLNYGSTTSGGSGAWWFGLPLSASNADGIQMACSMLNNGFAWYQGIANGTYAGFTNRTAIIAQSSGSNSSQGVDLGFPFVWGDADSLQFAGSYEIA